MTRGWAQPRRAWALLLAGCGPPSEPIPTAPAPGPVPADAEVVRFVAFGDAGTGDATQRAVAEAVRAVCRARTDDRPGCDFLALLGDNFYPAGPETADDPLFESHFERAYGDLGLPVYVAVGNHDYGDPPFDRGRIAAEVAYEGPSGAWRLPAPVYRFAAGPVDFLVLDTHRVLLEPLWGDSGQGDWVDAVLAGSDPARWRVVLTHHPFASNGLHGRAGAYEGSSWIPVASGRSVRRLYDDHLCGAVDLVLAGHDHNRQWVGEACGSTHVVSGAGAKVRPLQDRGVPTRFSDDTEPGFLWVEARADRMTGVFYGVDGALDFEAQVARRRPATLPEGSAGVP